MNRTTASGGRIGILLSVTAAMAMLAYEAACTGPTNVVYINADGSTSMFTVIPIDQSTIQQCCGKSVALTKPGATDFVSQHARGLVQLAAPGGMLVSCAAVEGSSVSDACMVAATCRAAGTTNTFVVGITFGYDNAGILDTVAFDRAIDGLGGETIAAGTPMPAATVMRMLALARSGSKVPVEDLTVLASKYSFTYKAPDASNAVSKTSVTAIAPTAYTNFRQIAEFSVFAQPEGNGETYLHRFKRCEIVTSEKGDKYVHPFMMPGQKKPVGLFTAKLKDNTVKFKYAMAPSNADLSLITTGAYEMIQSNMATNPPLKGDASGYFEFAMDGETHFATNIPALFKANKTAFSGKSIKVKKQ